MARVLCVGGGDRRLRSDEFETVTADSAAAAADAVADGDVDCVVVDADGAAGLAPVEAVRERAPAVPVVVRSAEADGELAAAATRRGATEYCPATTGPSLADRVRATLDGDDATGALARTREAELERYRAVIENVQHMVYVVDENERLSLVTEPLAEWLGYDRETLVGRHPGVMLADGEVERFERELERLDGDGTAPVVRVETEAVDADGDTRPVEVELTHYRSTAEEGAVGVVRDRSDLVQARRRLETQRNRFTYLFDNLPDAVVEATLDEDGRPIVRNVNDAFTDVFGYEAETVEGESLNDFVLPPDAREEGRRLDRRAADGEVTNSEVRRRTADGYRDFLFRGVPFEETEDGTHGFGIYTDITDQKERERRLEVLNRVLRHNLRNDLNVVLGYAEMLADGLEGERGAQAAALREKTAELVALSDRARSLDRVIGRGSPRDSTVDLGTVVEEALDGVDLDVETDLVDARVVGDARLRLAVEELLANAVEHAGPDPEVRIGIDRRGPEVRLTVADDGPGIPDDERSVIAGSTEITQLRHGTGLGLWVVKWVCESCGGRLEFADSPLGGAAVALALTPADD